MTGREIVAVDLIPEERWCTMGTERTTLRANRMLPRIRGWSGKSNGCGARLWRSAQRWLSMGLTRLASYAAMVACDVPTKSANGEVTNHWLHVLDGWARLRCPGTRMASDQIPPEQKYRTPDLPDPPRDPSFTSGGRCEMMSHPGSETGLCSERARRTRAAALSRTEVAFGAVW